MSKSNSTVDIRPLAASDLIEVHRVASLSFPVPWKEPEFLFFLAHEHGWNRGAFLGQQMVGYLLALLLNGGEMDIVSIAVDPKVRRQGIGKVMVGCAQEEKNISRLLLEVREDNGEAFSLYSACGFRVFGRRRKYYEGKIDALCMEWMKSTG